MLWARRQEVHVAVDEQFFELRMLRIAFLRAVSYFKS